MAVLTFWSDASPCLLVGLALHTGIASNDVSERGQGVECEFLGFLLTMWLIHRLPIGKMLLSEVLCSCVVHRRENRGARFDVFCARCKTVVRI
jgi:hypothetical protein